MSTPVPDDDYPEAWRPKERRQRDATIYELELALAALPVHERTAMWKRIEENS